MKKKLQIILLAVLTFSFSQTYSQAGTADGTYHFGSLGATNSGGAGFKTQGDKFKVSNAYVSDGMNGLYDGSSGQSSNQQSTLIIKAEGGLVCKMFTLKDIALYTLVYPNTAVHAYSMFTVSLYGLSGNLIATHSIASDINIGENAILKLKDIPFTNAWPVAGYPNVSEVRITFVATNTLPNILGFSNITLTDISASTLSANLTSYTVSKSNNFAEINWKTVSEQNNKNFIIFRSGDDKNYEKLEEVSGNGTTTSANNYTYHDKNPLSGNNYYKLVQVDFDGKLSILGEEVLNFGLSDIDIKVYPNPTTDYIFVTTKGKKYNRVLLTNTSGKTLQDLKLREPEDNIELSLSNYSPGIYFINLIGKEGVSVKKITKK